MSVREEHGMTCPKCGRDDKLEIVAGIWVQLVPDGTQDSDDGHMYWDGDSECRCRHDSCGWHGRVRAAYGAVK